MQNLQIKRNSIVELDICTLVFGGKGLGRINNFVIFVNGALPGQIVKAQLRKVKKNFAEAEVIDIVRNSPNEVSPICEHFKACGGCVLQNLDYQAQLSAKRDQVVQSLYHLAKLETNKIAITMASPDIYFYRNKMEFTFAPQNWIPNEKLSYQYDKTEKVFLGLHARGYFNRIVDINYCHLLSEQSNRILHTVREFARKSTLSAYDSRNQSGFWRFLVIREGKNTGDVMVNVITSHYVPEVMEDLQQTLLASFPQLSSLINSITSSKAAVAVGQKEFLLAGKATILERIAEHKFEISANSFFQTNTRQAENLYNIALAFAQLTGNETVYDLYSGAGTIAIHFSHHAKQVVGFEVISSAIKDARRNAIINNITNCHFIEIDLKELSTQITQLISEHGRPEVMVIDPPRAGMHPKTVQAILELNPERIVHVSCNPTTLARDLAILCKSQYRLTKVQPIDMFPHTAHIEVVAQLLRI